MPPRPHEALQRETALREHGVSRTEQVASAVLEIDGTISVVPFQEPTVHKMRHV
ncbi:YetF domain-containing protein, partial [Meiothermus taiwanensis]